LRAQDTYDKWYDRAVRMAGIGLDTIRDKADVLMERFMVEELADFVRVVGQNMVHGVGPWTVVFLPWTVRRLRHKCKYGT